MYRHINCEKIEKTNRYGTGLAFIWCIWMIISSGAVSIWNVREGLTILINFLWIAFLLLHRNPLRIKKKHFLTLITILVFLLCYIVILLAGPYTWGGTLRVLSNVLMCFLVFEKFYVSDIVRNYCKIMQVIAILSLLTYIFQPFILEYKHLFPLRVSINHEEGIVTHYTNIYIALLRWEGARRNHGIFWEPGAFQVFLNVSLMFELFILKEDRKTYLRLIVLIFAIATTLSTASITNLLVLLLAYLLSSDTKNKKQNLILLLSLVAISSVLFGSQVIENIEYKFGLKTGVVSGNVTSRIQPFLLDLKLMSENLFGVGIDRYAIELTRLKNELGMYFHSSSCTQTVFGASFGIMSLMLIIYGSWKLSKRVNSSRLSAVLIFLFIQLLFSTESFIFYPLFYFLVFGGICTDMSEWSC